MHEISLFIAAIGIKGILVLCLSILVVVFIIKKLLKVAIVLAIIAVVIHFAYPYITAFRHGIQ